ncbi:MAG: permease-like cell division protein FtsX [Thermoleophilia bacterium]
MRCPNCGKEVLASETFCAACGYILGRKKVAGAAVTDPPYTPKDNKAWRLAAIIIVFVLLIIDLAGVAGLALARHSLQSLVDEDPPEIEVFVKNTATPVSIQGLGREIEAMPEARNVVFVSKEEALQRLRESLAGHEEVLDALSGNPLPPSFVITLRGPENIDAMASRFFNNPLVDNTPGTHDGVKYSSSFWQDYDNNTKIVSYALLATIVFAVILAASTIILLVRALSTR